MCKQLEVPLDVVPLTDEYWQRVVATCVREIQAGRTPNPDILCNSRVKFGAFYEYLERQHAQSFDRVASGHYARLIRPASGDASGSRQLPKGASPGCNTVASRNHGASEGDKGGAHGTTNDGAVRASAQHSATGGAAEATATGRWLQEGACGTGVRRTETVQLALTPDAVKDQTYFLAHLSQAQVANAMFPLGHMTKADVRQLAETTGLATKHRKDSQGICFLGKVKFSEFVKVHHCPTFMPPASRGNSAQARVHANAPQHAAQRAAHALSRSVDAVKAGTTLLQEHLGEWIGPVIEEETNKVVATHKGFWFYTIGQRSGLDLGHLPNGPWCAAIHCSCCVRPAHTCGSSLVDTVPT